MCISMLISLENAKYSQTRVSFAVQRCVNHRAGRSYLAKNYRIRQMGQHDLTLVQALGHIS